MSEFDNSENKTVANNNFIKDIINEDLKTGHLSGAVHTRFPPEPNGYLHIGHAKSICLNFGLAKEYGGLCNLRFDDTNPVKEEEEFILSIQEDVRWLGFDWAERLFFASDYFEQLYNFAVDLIRAGKAYICDLSQEETRAYRGTLTEAGKESPYRSRSVEENLNLFAEMRAGKYADGERVLKAKIDMASPNINLRDPVLYRINRAVHPHTGSEWCIYPMYDYAHPVSDALEGITHSICTLEFENNRPLYNWVLANLDIDCVTKQIEFARLNITYTVLSKRKLRRLVEGGYVCGWDDPRMPTIAGMRRRGYTPAAIRSFCEMIGVAKGNSMVEIEQLEHCIRADLNISADRVMVVANPLKLIITNYPDTGELLPAENNPGDPDAGTRMLNFSREIYIERDDFMEEPVKGFHRLIPGGEVRLKHAYIITCDEVVKDADGNIVELRCSYDPETKSGSDTSGKKVKGTVHWVDAGSAVDVEIRYYDRLFSKESPEDLPEGEEFTDYINPESLVTVCGKAEASLANPIPGTRYQFLRQGYFTADSDSAAGKPIFNRTAALKDGWTKQKQ